MTRCTLLAVIVVTSLGGAAIRASDPVGIYAIVDKVLFEPSDAAPERIQVWGAFALSGAPGTGDSYSTPVRGYLYYSFDHANEEITRKEWSDLRGLAGTDQCIGLANRYTEKGRVRGGCETPAKPDPYPISALGLQKLRSDTDYPPIQGLLSMPAPRSPEDGSRNVEPGRVTLAVRNILTDQHPGAKYLFQLANAYGETLTSPEVPPGKTHTQWTPSIDVRAGEAYTWSAWAVDAGWKGAPSSACFQLFFLRGDFNADREVDISDAVSILLFLFAGGAAPGPREAADADGNGEVQLTDAVYLLMYLFQGGSPPPPPFPEAGLMPPTGR